MPCDATCDGCSLSSTNCILCASGSFRQIGSNACGSCAAGYYGDASTILCTVCPVGCSACTSATVCSACQAVAGVSYHLLSGECLSVCPSTHFNDSTNGVCTACANPCVTCVGPSTACLTCNASTVLNFGTTTCSATCPAGEYDGGSGQCEQC